MKPCVWRAKSFSVESYFLAAGIALCLFSLWAIARHDWLRLTRPSRRVTAQISGHLSQFDDGSYSYAAIFTFADDGREHEVVDAAYHPTPRLPPGTMAELTFPAGYPELARPPRPLLWVGVYALLLGMLAILAAKALGILAG